MKRLSFFCVFMALSVILLGFFQTAVDPADYTGEWYSADDQHIYLFQDGLIYCDKHAVPVSDTAYLCGAYSYCKDSILLFASGMDGLEKEKELYLVQNADRSLLCENQDGTGPVYFIRYHK